jgi:hypothetical protein
MLGAGLALAEEPVTVRILPQAAATNVVPLRLGLQAGFFEGTGGLFRSACFVAGKADAEEQAAAAIRKAGPGVLLWPVCQGQRAYDWYGGVGPRGQRCPAVSGAQEGGHDLGTVEFVAFCRKVGAEPLLRVLLRLPGAGDAQGGSLSADLQRAADWVAYCNATNDHPLAALRRRHGAAEALGVKRWELAVPDGVAVTPGVLAATRRVYAAAMMAEDPSIRICEGPGPLLVPLRDRYVAQLMRRLADADAAERAYFENWYEVLSVANAALERLRLGAEGPVCAPFWPQQMFQRTARGRDLLTAEGLLVAAINRFPAVTPLALEGAPSEADASFRVLAAWGEDARTLVIFVYNSGVEARGVRLDLTALKRRFAFWYSDQLAAEVSKPRTAPTVPVVCHQKAGSAMSQVVFCECQPASFTRIAVKK